MRPNPVQAERNHKQASHIGTGKAGFLFGQAVQASTHGNLVALAAATQAEADDAARQLGGVSQAAGDWKALIANVEVDAVFVCSPTFLHVEMTIAAAEAGQHVLCDKPICLSSSEADAMIAACDKADVILMIGFIERFNNAFRVMKDRIKHGHIGEPVAVLSRRAHPPRKGTRIMGGGVFLHTGCHNIDLIQWLSRRWLGRSNRPAPVLTRRHPAIQIPPAQTEAKPAPASKLHV